MTLSDRMQFLISTNSTRWIDHRTPAAMTAAHCDSHKPYMGDCVESSEYARASLLYCSGMNCILKVLGNALWLCGHKSIYVSSQVSCTSSLVDEWIILVRCTAVLELAKKNEWYIRMNETATCSSVPTNSRSLLSLGRISFDNGRLVQGLEDI